MNRRNFFRDLVSGLVITSSPQIFIPKLIKPRWKAVENNLKAGFYGYLEEGPIIICSNIDWARLNI